MTKEPTSKQVAVLDMLVGFTLRFGYQPSYRAMAKYFGWASPAAAVGHLQALERKGLVKLTGRPRAVHITSWPDLVGTYLTTQNGGLLMPNTVRKIGGKWRVVEKSTGEITKNAKGTAVDGGGHGSREEALEQAQAINISQNVRKKKRLQ